MFFRELMGQARVVTLLQHVALHGRIANGYLFSGPVDSGQKVAALAFARLVNCEQPQDGDACGACRPCRQLEQGHSPDLLIVEPQGAKIKIEQIRALGPQTQFGPAEFRWRFILVDEAEKMTEPAANSFLKLLEEPAENTAFILLTFNESALLPTLVSRCQRIKFNFSEPDTHAQGEASAIWAAGYLDLFRMAESAAESKVVAQGLFNQLLTECRKSGRLEASAVLLHGLRKLNYNVNVRLVLEDTLLKVKGF
jgi:DNA polymerase-3 subunit delta'